MIIIKNKTSWTWYILMGVYLLYFGQSSFFPSLTIVGQLLIFLILFIGLINLFRSLKYLQIMPNCVKLIIAMLVIITLSYIASPKIVSSILMPHTSTLNQFKEMVAFYLPIFTGFQIGLHKKISPKQWAYIALIILLIAVNSYFTTRETLIQQLNREEVTNNSAYVFLYILAFLPLILKKYKIIALSLLSACFVFVMMGAKRGAIICMSCMILYLLWWYLNRRRISFGTIVTLLLVITALIIGLSYFFTANDYLQQRLEQTIAGNSSHRDVLYFIIWESWLNADLTTQLFGRGTAQTITLAGNYAHNDWLELLTDVGLLGTFIYLSIFISLFFFRKKFKKNSPEQAAFTVVIIFWFLKTIFSMGMGIMGGISMMLIGTLMGNAIGVANYKVKTASVRTKIQTI